MYWVLVETIRSFLLLIGFSACAPSIDPNTPLEQDVPGVKVAAPNGVDVIAGVLDVSVLKLFALGGGMS